VCSSFISCGHRGRMLVWWTNPDESAGNPPPACTRERGHGVDVLADHPETAIARPELRALAERFGVMMQELLEALAYLAKRGYLRPERRSGKSPAYRLSVEPAGQMSPPSSARRPTSTTSLLVFPPARRRDFIRRHAARMAALTADGAEAYHGRRPGARIEPDAISLHARSASTKLVSLAGPRAGSQSALRNTPA
jgi:DNA-binding transcriptional MocR family regulator